MKNNISLNVLKNILDQLSQISEPTEKCHIMADSGYDESVIVGTDRAFMYLARKMIEIIYFYKIDEQNIIDFDDGEIAEVKSSSTNEIKFAFEEIADVWPICAYIAEDEAAVKAIVKEFNE
ncbi:hypothetical protein PN36_34740 [Candidatus Thiomargarita nelsonii]|uniref:Uncharacterized protein n=1 Tax=Candidatus Thiomargarita nelsonii TaxID=1003181 RepID=A0A0A6RN70_9GAMM|nr:hypothetical protein PN36_34740 [Candidatus Thiomargarita nelsonii]